MSLSSFFENHIKINLAILFYKLGFLPKNYHTKIKAILSSRIFFKKFKKLDLISHDSGYLKVSPMPTSDYLNNFYKKINWDKSNEKNYPIKLRDIQHYNLFKQFFPNINKDKKNILNFGAGHAGISILFHIAGHNIYNLEPSGVEKYFQNNWTTISKFTEIHKKKIDIIYASHSLEHVPDIEAVIKNFKKIGHENTIFFFEVPNHPIGLKHTIDPPHTYYYSRIFFNNNFKDVIHNATYSKNGEIKKEDSGQVIRFIAK